MQPLAHSHSTGTGKEERKNKSRKLVGQDKNCLISKGGIEKENKTKEAMQRQSLTTSQEQAISQQFPKQKVASPLKLYLRSIFVADVTLYGMEHPFAEFESPARWCSIPTCCAPSICLLLRGSSREGNRRPRHCANTVQQ